MVRERRISHDGGGLEHSEAALVVRAFEQSYRMCAVSQDGETTTLCTRGTGLDTEDVAARVTN